jgi:hypothetical protein
MTLTSRRKRTAVLLFVVLVLPLLKDFIGELRGSRSGIKDDQPFFILKRGKFWAPR